MDLLEMNGSNMESGLSLNDMIDQDMHSALDVFSDEQSAFLDANIGGSSSHLRIEVDSQHLTSKYGSEERNSPSPDTGGSTSEIGDIDDFASSLDNILNDLESCSGMPNGSFNVDEEMTSTFSHIKTEDIDDGVDSMAASDEEDVINCLLPDLELANIDSQDDQSSVCGLTKNDSSVLADSNWIDMINDVQPPSDNGIGCKTINSSTSLANDGESVGIPHSELVNAVKLESMSSINDNSVNNFVPVSQFQPLQGGGYAIISDSALQNNIHTVNLSQTFVNSNLSNPQQTHMVPVNPYNVQVLQQRPNKRSAVPSSYIRRNGTYKHARLIASAASLPKHLHHFTDPSTGIITPKSNIMISTASRNSRKILSHTSNPVVTSVTSAGSPATHYALTSAPSLLMLPHNARLSQPPRHSYNKSHKKSSHGNGDSGGLPKPPYSYSCLISLALKNSQTGSMSVSEIYQFMCEHFPYFRSAPSGWKNSVRHNLSLNKCFEKIERPSPQDDQHKDTNQRKGCLWAMNPTKMHKMDEEVHKWSMKDPTAIKKGMAVPENLEALERGEMVKDYSVSTSDCSSGFTTSGDSSSMSSNNAHSSSTPSAVSSGQVGLGLVSGVRAAHPTAEIPNNSLLSSMSSVMSSSSTVLPTTTTTLLTSVSLSKPCIQLNSPFPTNPNLSLSSTSSNSMSGGAVVVTTSSSPVVAPEIQTIRKGGSSASSISSGGSDSAIEDFEDLDMLVETDENSDTNNVRGGSNSVDLSRAAASAARGGLLQVTHNSAIIGAPQKVIVKKLDTSLLNVNNKLMPQTASSVLGDHQRVIVDNAVVGKSGTIHPQNAIHAALPHPRVVMKVVGDGNTKTNPTSLIRNTFTNHLTHQHHRKMATATTTIKTPSLIRIESVKRQQTSAAIGGASLQPFKSSQGGRSLLISSANMDKRLLGKTMTSSVASSIPSSFTSTTLKVVNVLPAVSVPNQAASTKTSYSVVAPTLSNLRTSS